MFLSRLALLGAAPFLALGFLPVGFSILDHGAKPGATDRWEFFLAGAVIFCLLYLPFRSQFCFLNVSIHEHLHFLFNFFRRPKEMRVSSNEGCYSCESGRYNVLCWIAPYCVPPAALAVILIAVVADDAYENILLVVLGAATALDAIRIYGDCGFHQTDLRTIGKLFSLVVLPVLNLISFGGVFAFASLGLPGLNSFWIGGLTSSAELFVTFIHWALGI